MTFKALIIAGGHILYAGKALFYGLSSPGRYGHVLRVAPYTAGNARFLYVAPCMEPGPLCIYCQMA